MFPIENYSKKNVIQYSALSITSFPHSIYSYATCFQETEHSFRTSNKNDLT